MQVGILGRVTVMRRDGEYLHLGEHPRHAVALNELAHHAVVNLGKVANVVLGVLELLGLEGALRPVGEALRLGEMDARVGLDERAVANLHAVAEEGGRHLRVEERLGDALHGTVEYLEVLGAGVDDLGDARVPKEPRHRGEVADGQRVNGGYVVRRGGELQQAESWMVRALSQELGIDGEKSRRGRALAEALELGGRGYEQDAPLRAVRAGRDGDGIGYHGSLHGPTDAQNQPILAATAPS